MLSFELKRAFHNGRFLIAVFIGCILAILQAAQEALPYAFGISLYPDQYPPSLYNTAMGFTFGVWSYVFYMIFPILAVLPFADSYFQELHSGYCKNLYIKTKRKNYLLAKSVAVFLSGGTAVAIPVLLNYFLVALCVPAIIPHAATRFFAVFSQAAGAELFYTYPLVYALLFVLLLFVTGGILACVALAFSYYLKHFSIVLLAPFLLYLAISYGLSLFSINNPLNISHWIEPMQSYQPLNPVVTALELVVLLAASLAVYFYKGLKNESI